MRIFKLPDLGEGLPEAEIVEWHIEEGDEVKVDQPMVSMETAKAIVEIPCPYSGKILKLYGAEGDLIHTGDPLVEFTAEVGDSETETGDEENTEVERESSSVVGELHETEAKLKESAESVSVGGLGTRAGTLDIGVKATPAVRALAHRRNIDLAIVTPSGPDGTIKASDVERVAKIFSEVGELKPLRGVRRSMAKAMTLAHAEVVPVTIHDDADVSRWYAKSDITTRVIRAMAKACQAEPGLNSWYDSHSIGRRIIQQMHLGLAVDTKDGLFVPVIRDAQNYDQKALREKIDSIKKQVELRKIPAEDLRGNTITLSNYGNMAGKYASPVVIPPTVAILGTGRLFKQLMMAEYDEDVIAENIENTIEEIGDEAGNIEQHTLLPLSLTFDHRSITGGEAARFLSVLIDDLERDE